MHPPKLGMSRLSNTISDFHLSPTYKYPLHSARLQFVVPSRGLMGFRSELKSQTSGQAVVNSLFSGYKCVLEGFQDVKFGPFCFFLFASPVGTSVCLKFLRPSSYVFFSPFCGYKCVFEVFETVKLCPFSPSMATSVWLKFSRPSRSVLCTIPCLLSSYVLLTNASIGVIFQYAGGPFLACIHVHSIFTRRKKDNIVRGVKGKLIASGDGLATGYALKDIEPRGTLFIGPGDKVCFGCLQEL